MYKNQKFNNLYSEGENLELRVVVVDDKKEKEYKDVFKVRVCDNSKYNNTYLYLSINKNQSKNIKYGDELIIQGEYVSPTGQRNEGGFDYKKYLKSLNIYGTLKSNYVEKIGEGKLNIIFMCSNKICSVIKEKVDTLLNNENASVFKGIILGDTSNIEKDIQEKFRVSNMAHILAVSGMHVAYVIIGINICLKNFLGKRKTVVLIIIFLISYMFLAGFSPSIVRAGIMGILVSVAKLIHRKNDTFNSMALSILIILMFNPYLLSNIGVLLSYFGTIGIILFRENVSILFSKFKIKNKKYKYKINKKISLLADKIKEILSVTISAQIMILPVIVSNFNFLNPYFLISGILVSIIIGPILVFGIFTILISIINFEVSSFFSEILSLGIQLLIKIANLSELPFSKIYVSTPNIMLIIIYYILVCSLNFILTIYGKDKLNGTMKRVKNLIALAKYRINQNKNKILIMLVIVVIFIILFRIYPKDLRIDFVDVGQGDCTLIVTPKNKTILIDGGGSLSKEYDVGKSTVLPFVLDKGFICLDYVIISHFDQDHVRRIVYDIARNKGEKCCYWKAI